MSKARAKKKSPQFQELAQGKRPSLVVEFLYFLKHNKKWWLLPIIVVLLLLCLLVVLGGSGAAVFIYPLF
jgi:hypothetical protein